MFGFGASSGLVLGSLIGARFEMPERPLAAVLAFAAGALMSALSFELFQASFEKAGVVPAAVGLVAGAATFIVIDSLLDRRVERTGGGSTGFSLLAAVTLDGVPENLALGTTIAAKGGSLALLVAIFASNFPEALVGARSMRENGRSARFAIVTWAVCGLLLALSVVAGSAVLSGASPATLAVILAFAGGAVLASLIDTIVPEAYAGGGPLVAFATVVGFLVSFVLGAS